ncbi:MAG: lysophospholipase [Gammaproteobacteria bacterium]|nr:lysophospholipase [Gammaproteobacteria bacterium]
MPSNANLEQYGVFLVVLLACLLSGCSHTRIARHGYPHWGEQFRLARSGHQQPLHIRILQSPKPATTKACLLIVHGLNEHVGRYQYIAEHFAQNFVVGGIDLSGHGLSNPIVYKADQSIRSGSEQYDVSDAYLTQAQFHDLEPMRADLHLGLTFFIQQCDQRNHEQSPVFILSHSLGSLVAASYLLGNDHNHAIANRINGIIFTGPAFSVTRVPGWKGVLQNPFIDFTYHIHEHFLTPHREPLPVLLFNQITALICVPIVDGVIELLSLPLIREWSSPVTPEWVVDYLTDWEPQKKLHRQDAYIIRRNVLRFVLGIEKEVIAFRRKMNTFSVPFLLIYAAGDPITPAWGNEDFAEQTVVNHPNNQVLKLDNASHHEQLFSNPDLTDEVLGTIDHWLQKRLNNHQSHEVTQ